MIFLSLISLLLCAKLHSPAVCMGGVVAPEDSGLTAVCAVHLAAGELASTHVRTDLAPGLPMSLSDWDSAMLLQHCSPLLLIARKAGLLSGYFPR